MEDVDAFSKELFRLVAEAMQRANSLSSSDISFYRTLSPSIGEQVDGISSRILRATNDIMNHQNGASGQITDHSGAHDSSCVPFVQFGSIDEVLDNFGLVIETVDNMLERIDYCLDFLSGKAANASQNEILVNQVQKTEVEVGSQKFGVLHSQSVLRPQLKFASKVDNSSAPFIHSRRGCPPSDADGQVHPYLKEITELELSPLYFEEKKEQIYPSLDSTKLHLVSTKEDLEYMISVLQQEKEIAVDLENHSYRSFQGFTCLMQISTRSEDYIIDLLELRDEMALMDAVFLDPEIVKVFHGADSDVQWLQRDFNIYMVNLFDTFRASQALEMAGNSLAHLLHYYCGVVADKKFQLADWRVRPLPEEMILYARQDTHYLLYVFDRMRNEILEKGGRNLMLSVLNKCKETSLKLYHKELFSENSWGHLYTKYDIHLDNTQLCVFRSLYKWRDHLAREEDESVHYIMPNYLLFKMSTRLPTDTGKLLSICHPVPAAVRLYATDLVIYVKKAIAEAKTVEVSVPSRKNPVHIRFEESRQPDEEQQQEEDTKDTKIQLEAFHALDTFETFISKKISISEGKMSTVCKLFTTPSGKIKNEAFLKIEHEIIDEFEPGTDISFVEAVQVTESVCRPTENTEPSIPAKRPEDKEAGPMILSGKGMGDPPLQFKKPKLAVEVAPFDYSKASPLLKVDDGKQKKGFDPYGVVIENEKHKKQDKSLKTNPRSGNRSMTFKK